MKAPDGRINVPTLVSIHSLIEFGLRRMRRTSVSPCYFVLIDSCSPCHTLKVKDIFRHSANAFKMLRFSQHSVCITALPPTYLTQLLIQEIRLLCATAASCHLKDKV